MGKSRKAISLKRAILDIGIFSAVVNVLLLVLPLYMIQIYDRVLSSGSQSTLIYISIIAIVALVVLGLVEVVRALYANRVAGRLDVAYGGDLFHAAMNGQNAGVGDVQPLRDLSTLRSFVGSRVVFFLFDLPFAPLFIVLLYFIHPVLFDITLVGGALMVAIAIANQYATAKPAKQAGESLSGAMNMAQGFARNFETVRALGMVRNVTERWGGMFSDSLQATDRLSRVGAFYASLSRTVRLLLQVATYGAGAYYVLHGEMTPGMIFAATMISARALQPLDQIVGSWKQVVDAGTAWRRLTPMMNAVQKQREETVELPAPKGSLQLEELIYQVPNAPVGAPPLIKRISLTVGAGETVAIIGPTRAGKSTLARLIVGALRPNAGVVRMDGADIRNWDPDDLGQHIGYLAQEVEFFPGTISQNIARFDPDAPSEKIIAAAERACCRQLVLAQPKGFDTPIGPTGVRLSGGERQRIGLARAFYGDPRILVLDEPNANLDSEGEAALETAMLDAKAAGSTVLLITHRPSIAAKCDKILMMRDGMVEAYGPAMEVLQKIARAAKPRPATGEVVPINPAQRGAAAAGQTDIG